MHSMARASTRHLSDCNEAFVVHHTTLKHNIVHPKHGPGWSWWRGCSSLCCAGALPLPGSRRTRSACWPSTPRPASLCRTRHRLCTVCSSELTSDHTLSRHNKTVQLPMLLLQRCATVWAAGAVMSAKARGRVCTKMSSHSPEIGDRDHATVCQDEAQPRHTETRLQADVEACRTISSHLDKDSPNYICRQTVCGDAEAFKVAGIRTQDRIRESPP